MEDWFRRKGYLKPGERLEVLEIGGPTPGGEKTKRNLC